MIPYHTIRRTKHLECRRSKDKRQMRRHLKRADRARASNRKALEQAYQEVVADFEETNDALAYLDDYLHMNEQWEEWKHPPDDLYYDPYYDPYYDE